MTYHYIILSSLVSGTQYIVLDQQIPATKELDMARRITLSQYRSKLQQAQAKQRQNIQKRNNAIQQYNNKVRQYNAARKQAIDAYNRKVRAHNARVRTNRTRLQSALGRLAQQTNTVRYTVLHKSVSTLSTKYKRLDTADANPFLSDLAEQETTNSVTVLNDLLDDDTANSQASDDELTNTQIANELAQISPDLDNRWHGPSMHSILRIPMLLAIFVQVPERSLQRFSIPRHQMKMFLLAFLTAQPQIKGLPLAVPKSTIALIETIM